MNKVNKSSKSKHAWLLQVFLGFSAVLICSAIYFKIFPRHSKAALLRAQSAGMDIDIAQDLVDLGSKISTSRTCAEDELARLKKYADNPSVSVSQNALGLMAQLNKSPFKSEIVEVAKAHINDRDAHNRATSLVVMHHMSYPGWREIATNWKNNPDIILRTSALAMLKRGG